MKFNIGPVVPLIQMLMGSYSSEHLKQSKLKKDINLSGHKVLKTIVSGFEYSV